jgi:DNA polymerase I - 3''-5'' exonuclease and polymerase domains
VYLVLSLRGDDVAVTSIDDAALTPADQTATRIIPIAGLPAFVAERERDERPRWVWDSTARWYPRLLVAGIRIERCVDLALSRTILRASALTAATDYARAPDDPAWHALVADVTQQIVAEQIVPAAQTLFDLDPAPVPTTKSAERDPVAELLAQRAAIAAASDPNRIRLLLAAESAGSLVAAELKFAGLPWRTDVHDRLLTELLGPRVPHGSRPSTMEELAARIRLELSAPTLNPDSQAELLKALQRAGLQVTSTRAWELREVEHPAIAPLLEYKKLSRLLTANGWTWMEQWIVDGRFHADYVPGGVVTGRWATNGGGAMQLPKQIRGAVVADPGWRLVVADAAQLEPRVLAGLAADRTMAQAGHGRDLYDGIVSSGAVDTRPHAKVAMLGAMYGATTGDSARLVPRLARAYPRAIALVEQAARDGERGEIVTSRLGRSSPRPGAAWRQTQAMAAEPGATTAEERAARSRARDWGRFTRNFVVQSSAAEWALCWMADLRQRLASIQVDRADAGRAATPFDRSPHLAFFLHDEVIVHAPAAVADRVADEIRSAARSAGRLLFGDFPVEFPLSVAIVDSYAEAK